MRIQFKKGKQREFIKKVLSEIGASSLRGLKQRGIDVNYSSLKNYFIEDRTMPTNLFQDLCKLANFGENEFIFERIDENWGKIKGGRKSRR